MDISSVIAELESAVGAQLEVSAGSEAVEAAASTLMAALEPALREAALTIAGAAATEISAQLPEGEVEVVLKAGNPELRYRPTSPGDVSFGGEELQARLTLRLPESLKTDLEGAAGELGDSLNTYVVRALSGRRHRREVGKRISGTIET
jgi:hypothetical protein